MPYLLSLRKGVYSFQYIVYIFNALFLFQWANLVAQTMGKTIFFCENVKKNCFLSLAQRRGMIRTKWLSFSCRDVSSCSFNYWLIYFSTELYYWPQILL